MKLPELKKRFKNKYVIRIAAGVLTVAVAGGSVGAYTVQAEKSAKTKTETTQESDKDAEEDLEEILTSKVSNTESDATKEETVYVVADNTGKADTVIVSDWLKNPDGKDKLEDESDLKDIKNVKGKEKYEEKDGQIIWNAKGNDIYYQGSTEKELPVTQTITYYLDGEEMEPEEIAGKSGKVTIRFDYKNNQKTTVTVDGKKHSVYVPFTILTGMALDDSYSNVEVKNGKVISDGDKQFVAGVVMPGLRSSLNVKSSDFGGDIDIPEYIEVTADVKDFKLDMTMSVMMSGVATGDDVEDIVDLSDLDDAIDTLSDSSSQLVDGTKQLKEGLDKLKASAPALAEGANTLNSSTGTLNSGIAQLDATLNAPMTDEAKAAAMKTAKEGIAAQAGTIKDTAKKGIATREQEIKDTALKGIAAQEKTIKDTATAGVKAKEQEIKDTAATGIATREQEIKDTAAKGVASEEQKIRDTAATGIAAQEQSIRELATAGVNAKEAEIKSEIENNKAQFEAAASQLVNASFAQAGPAIHRQVSETLAPVYTNTLKGQLFATLKAGYEAGGDDATTAEAKANAVLESLGTGLANGAADVSVVAAQGAADAAAKNAVVAGAKQGAVLGAQGVAGDIAYQTAQTVAGDAAILGAKGVAGDVAYQTAQTVAEDAAVQGAQGVAGEVAYLGAQGVAGDVAYQTAETVAQDAAVQGAQGVAGQVAVSGAEAAKAEIASAIETKTESGHSLVSGMEALKNGTQALADQVPTLISGVNQLAEGGTTLNEGMIKFDEEGIQKLADTYNGDVKGLMEKVAAVMKAGSNYQTFSDKTDDAVGEVKFIIRTEGVKEKED